MDGLARRALIGAPHEHHALNAVHIVGRGRLRAVLGGSGRLRASRPPILHNVIIASQLIKSAQIAHFRRYFPHIELLEVWAAFEAELDVAFLVEEEVAVERQVAELRAVLQAGDAREVGDLVVGEEDALQVGTVVQPVHLVDYVPPQVQLRE